MTRLALLGLVVAGCVHVPQIPPPTFLARATELDTLRELALRYQFASARGKLYCVEIVPNDATPSFLARFADFPVPVMPGSACGLGADDDIHEKSSGRTAILFRVLSVTWDDNTGRGQVASDKISATPGSGGFIYNLRRLDGVWRVVSARQSWLPSR